MKRPIELEDTGERMIPAHHKGRNIYGSHIARYHVATPYITDKVVLDIACGSGYGTQLMSKYAKRIYGVDISKETVEYAKKHFNAKNIEYKEGDGITIPMDENSVDVVVSYETIEHIPDYEGFMKEVKRVLKPNGVLLLSTPNDDEYIEGNPFHFYEFNYSELKKLTQKYFKHHKDYFQTQWLSSTILPQNLQSSEWEQKVNTLNTVKLSPEQCIYFLIVCSNEEIVDTEPISVIGEHFRLLDAEKNHNETMGYITKLEKQIQIYETSHKQQLTQIEDMLKSRSWKFSKPLRTSKYIVKNPKLAAKKIVKKLRR